MSRLGLDEINLHLGQDVDLNELKSRPQNELTIMLHDLVESGLEQGIDLLIELGADVNGSVSDHAIPLFCALRHDRFDIAQKLLRLGADVNVCSCNGCAGLHYVGSGCSESSVKWLLDHGADVDIKNGQGNTPLMLCLAAFKGKSEECIQALESIAKLLIEHGADVNVQDATYFFTPLHFAIKNQRCDFVKYLISQGASFDIRDCMDGTALNHAAAGGSLEIVKTLVDAGCDIDVFTYGNLTPLLNALKHGHEDVALYLIEQGADTSTIDGSGRTCFTAAIEGKAFKIAKKLIEQGLELENRGRHYFELHYVCELGSLKGAKMLLDAGADASRIADNGALPIFCAIAHPDFALTQLLLDHGSSVSCVTGVENDTNGKTLFIEALAWGHEDHALLLIEKGVDIHAVGPSGTTALHLAAGDGYDQRNQVRFLDRIAKVLVENKADLNAKNINDATSLHVAASSGLFDAVQFLVDHGADIDPITNDKSTPLMDAIRSECEDIALYLLNKGARIDLKDENETSCLHLAARMGSEKLIKILLDRGLDIEAKTTELLTPLYCACLSEKIEAVKLLLKAGADANALVKQDQTCLKFAKDKGLEEIVKLLKQHGAKK